jgi:hypothetical protein
MTLLSRYIQKPSRSVQALCLLSMIAVSGCRKYLEVPLPINSIAGASAFNTDNSSGAALNSVYNELYTQGEFAGTGSAGYLTGLYGDELRNLSTLPSNQALYGDAVSSTVGGVTGIWTSLYSQLYSVNLAIESLPAVSGLIYKNQWMGEAYFLRGLMYFYLTNLYGDVPLVLSSNFEINNTLGRSPQGDVYKQIVSDLEQARTLLDDNYHDATGATATDRGRPNRMAASALLAKVYLYTQDWKNAEVRADSVIADAADYQLGNLSQTFLIGSPEIIWGIEPSINSYLPYIAMDEAAYFMPAGTDPVSAGATVCLSDSLVKAFEPGDARFADWVGADTVPANGAVQAGIYHFAYKYKAIGTFTVAQESEVVLRLAEQYLIRAEARAEQGNLTGPNSAVSDLNVVRTRASLPPSAAVSPADVLSAIARERRVELFTELGNRFMDLRRTGTLNALMTGLAPLKGGGWQSFNEWWPIPLTDIQNNKSLTQTPGYQ